jgi:hypothetical protein
MELVTQGVSVFSYADLLKRDNLVIAHLQRRERKKAANGSSHVAFTPFAIVFQAVYSLGYQF